MLRVLSGLHPGYKPGAHWREFLRCRANVYSPEPLPLERFRIPANLWISPRMLQQFLFYELFRDEAAFKTHQESAHFKTYIAGQALPLVAKRERAQYALL